MTLLEIKDLYVSINDKELLKGIDLTIDKGETHVLMGPNASGKTTLVLTLLGYPAYKITKGRILFRGEDLTEKDITQRAKLGIALAYQTPPEVRGVKLRDILIFIAAKSSGDSDKEEKATSFLQRVGLEPTSFLPRDINVGFSGGEKKRAELAQIFAMRPELMILDEPDSGVDIDSLRLIGREIRKVVEELKSGVLAITHHRHILQYLKSNLCHIIYDGKILVSGPPEEIVPSVEELGYEKYIKRLRLK